MVVVQMAEHLYQQPTMVDLLVGKACEVMALKQFNRLVVTSNATEENLRFIQQTLAKNKHTWSSDLPGILDYEKLMLKNLWAIYYETNDKGKIRLTRDVTAAMRAQSPQDAPQLTYWQKKLMKANTLLGWFFVPSTPQKTAEIIDAAYERYYTMAQPDFDWKEEPKKFSLTSVRFNYRCMVNTLVGMSERTYHGLHDLYLRLLVNRRGSRLIIALRQYKNKNGHWPESLDDIQSLTPAETLVDPISNSPFVYRLTDAGFTLYSKGKNNIDENGRRDIDDEEGGPDDRLIWPEKSRHAEKVNKNDEQ